MKESLWKFFAWLSIICGLAAYFIGWAALVSQTAVWGIKTDFYFFDAIAAGLFGVFFLLYAVHYGKKS